MRTVTGIELGVDSCVLARVRPGTGTLRLSAVHGLDEHDWNNARSLEENLRAARRAGRFPAQAGVVAWGLHQSASAADPLTRAALAPLRNAGFNVVEVLSPPEALLRLSQQRSRPDRDGEVWLALNRNAAAIAIVAVGRLLYSRTFDWNYRPPVSGKEELLQRYSLVAHLAPEIRHGLEVVRAQHGAAVSVMVTCGDLPDLRSLTMPLIEELDIEVETLDTLDGITVEGMARTDAIAERAPALRLACAAAPVPSSAVGIDLRRVALAAALAALMVLTGWLTVRYVQRPRSTAGERLSRVPPVDARRPAAAPGPAPASRAGGGEAEKRFDPTVPAATTGSHEAPVEITRPTDAGAARRVMAERPRAARPETAREPLLDPLPVVNSILVAPDRRLAVVDGEIVREGDTVGRRVVARIERGAIVLREPSGHEVQVAIRRKVS